MTQAELLAIIGFMRGVRASEALSLGLSVEDPFFNMALYLIERHLEKKPVSVTSLAQSAGIPYASARRRISEMSTQGLIRRVKPEPGSKQQLVEPSELLLNRFVGMATDLKERFAGILGMSAPARDTFYFGAAYMRARIIPPPSPRPDIGQDLGTLRLLFKRQPSLSSFSRMRAQFEQLTNSRLAIEIGDFLDLRASILANGALDQSAFDLIAVPFMWMPELVERGMLLRLDELWSERNSDAFDFYPAAWGASKIGGHLYGIPVEPSGELLCYRRDIFAEHGLSGPSSVSELLDAGRRLHRPDQGRFGLAWCAAPGQPLGQSFLNFLADFGGAILDCERSGPYVKTADLRGEALRPRLKAHEAFAAVDYMLALKDISCPEILDMAWDERLNAYLKGRAMMAFNWSSRVAEIHGDRSSPAARSTAIAPHPTIDSLPLSPLGGYALCVPSGIDPDRLPGIIRALLWITSPEVSKQVAINGASASPRISVSADPDVAASNEAISVIDGLARSDRLVAWPNPPMPEFFAMAELIGRTLHNVLAGELTIAEGLTRAQNAVDAHMRAHGHY